MKQEIKKILGIATLGLMLASGFAMGHATTAFAEDQQADSSSMEQQSQEMDQQDQGNDGMDSGDSQGSYDSQSTGDELQPDATDPQEDMPVVQE